jgi:hypothetical protein
MKYTVTGKCTNPGCTTSIFTTQRRSVTSKPTSGGVTTIKNVVCPDCRTWGEVVEIQEVSVL